jgi:hypothetical protein
MLSILESAVVSECRRYGAAYDGFDIRQLDWRIVGR